MVSLLNPLPLISFQAPCASPDVTELESVPPKDSEMESLVSASAPNYIASLCQGELFVFVEFLFVERSDEQPFCHRLFMGIPPQMGTVKTWALQLI